MLRKITVHGGRVITAEQEQQCNNKVQTEKIKTPIGKSIVKHVTLKFRQALEPVRARR